jgi:hypothetical protein
LHSAITRTTYVAHRRCNTAKSRSVGAAADGADGSTSTPAFFNVFFDARRAACAFCWLCTRLAALVASDCALVLARTMDLPTMASEIVRNARSRGSSMNWVIDRSTRALTSSFAAAVVGGCLLLVVAVALEEEEDGAYLFDKLVKMDARDSARSMACLVAAEDMIDGNAHTVAAFDW